MKIMARLLKCINKMHVNSRSVGVCYWELFVVAMDCQLKTSPKRYLRVECTLLSGGLL